MSSVVALELSKHLFLQRWVWDRPSRVKSPVYQAYSYVVRQILQTTKGRPQSEDPIKVARHILSPTHCSKHHIANLPSPIAVPNEISEVLLHTLVARQPWCKIHGSHPSVHWCVPYGLNTPLFNNQTSWTDTPCNRKPRRKTSQCSNSSAMRPKIKYANVLYMSLILAMGRKSVVVCAFFVFGNTGNIILFQNDGIFPVCKILSWCPGELSQHCPA